MTRHGAYANRNAGHKERRAAQFSAACGEQERLAAAFDWFRSSAELLRRRRPPAGIGQEAHLECAARLVREMTEHLKTFAEAIDRGDYDAGKG